MLRNLFPGISQRMRLSLIMLVMTLVLGLFYLATRQHPASEKTPGESTSAQRMAVEASRTIRFGETEPEGEGGGESMAQRKKRYGIIESVDMIVTSDESIQVGDETLVMREFEEQVALSKGSIISLPLEGGDTAPPAKSYGIHVVRPGDNIWIIHFRLLREYLASREIHLPLSADKPGPEGHSSGIGKVLKFSERMVRIYSLKEKEFSDRIDVIHPFEKVLIYNLEEMRELLDTLTQENVNRIRFDGKNLWIEAE